MAGAGQIAWLYCSRVALRRCRQYTQLSDSFAQLGEDAVEPSTRHLFTRHYSASALSDLQALSRSRRPSNGKHGNQLSTSGRPASLTITTAAGSSSPVGHAHACISNSDAYSEQQEQQSAPGEARQAGNERHSTQPPARAVTLDGRESSAAWLHELRPSVTEVTEALGRAPGLCVIHVGDRPDSSVYVKRKEEACDQMHVSSKVVRLPSSVDQEELHAAIDAACEDPEIDGVLVQLPLPPHLNEYDVMERVDPRKDVDGFHPLNMGRMLARNAPPRFVPATALGCMQLLKRYAISVTKKHVVVLGDSNIVGTPLSVLLRDAGAGTVTVCHRIAYNNLFDDRTAPRMRPQLRADACLPRLPGPYSPETDPKEAPWLSTTLPCLDDKSAPHSSATLGVQERASGTTYSLGRDSDRSTQHEASTAGGHNPLAQAFHDLNSTASTSSNITRSFSSHLDAAEDAHTLRQLTEVLQERARGTSSSSSSEAGGWDDDMQLAALTRTADILVVAVGYPELVRSEWVKRGATVLDVGINIVPHDTSQKAGEHAQHGSIVGDVEGREVSQVASALTPVPGGIGPMTIAALIHNVVLAAKYRTKIQKWEKLAYIAPLQHSSLGIYRPYKRQRHKPTLLFSNHH